MDLPTISSDVYVSVCMYLYVPAIISKQQIQNVITVEITNTTPTCCANRATLQLLIVTRIDAIKETTTFYSLCHIKYTSKD